MASGRYVAVVGIDFSDLSNHAVDAALEIAGLRHGELHVVYVEPERALEAALSEAFRSEVDPATALEKVRQRATERLVEVGKRFASFPPIRVVAHFRRGSPAREVAQLAADLDADLVVVGSHGRSGAERLILGSVAEHVSRLARCPVWIVRPKNHDKATRVPEIEPPCSDCVAQRFATQGKELWCHRHAEHHIRAHGFRYVSEGMYDASTTPYESTPQ
jgi:nucleotide-binding universal stress UspA family protein